MSKNITNVIPFKFGKQEVRTILIDDQPWFVASDVALALMYAEAKDMTRNLDDDEKGRQIVPTLGGDQEMLVINESGLYSAILRSRKPEAKRFKKWVTSEVLPAIRKHGRYIDSDNQMTDLVHTVIGNTGEVVLDRVIEQKGYAVPAGLQRSFKHTMKSRLRSRFNVQKTSLIPSDQMADACNFIASYALEGEFLGKEAPAHHPQLNLSFPLETLVARRPGMMIIRNAEQAWLDITLHDLRDIRGDETPCEKLLGELKRAGYDIEGCRLELRTYRNKLHDLASFVTGAVRTIEDPHRYAVKPRTAA